MKTFSVMLPIHGHAIVEVEAETKEQAIEKAMEMVKTEHIEEWDVHHECRGSVCSFPSPWSPEADET